MSYQKRIKLVHFSLNITILYLKNSILKYYKPSFGKVIALVCIALTWQGTSVAQSISAKVIEVIDGNTFEVITTEKETLRLVLQEVDCPELGQLYSEEAKDFSKKILYKKKITIFFQGKDRFGNSLVDLELRNGKNIYEELVKNGLAWQNKRQSSDKSIESLQNQAKRNKIGLWSEENPTPPWVYRRKQTMLSPKSR